jgi:DNA-binding transcriptional LysR family regulator
MADLAGIEVFVKVVELAGISAAARATGLAKSSVSREIARLEARLGVRLLQRSTRALKLTEAGAEYYARCVAIVAEAQAAERAVSQAARAPRGLLRVTATVGFGTHYLAPLVIEYMAAHPEVRLELHLLDRRVNLIEEGFDLAIRMGALEDSTLTARRLGTVERALCAHPDYLARRGVPRLPEDLRRHACLSIDAEQRQWTLGGTTVTVPWHLACNHVEVVREAALAGAGLALLPRFLVAADLAAGRLVQVLPGARPKPTTFYALYPYGRQLPLSARLFLDMLLRRFGPDAPLRLPQQR